MIIFGWNARQWNRVLGWYEKRHGKLDWADLDVLVKARRKWIAAGGALVFPVAAVGF